ncbi:MAG: DNA repair protein RadC [Bacteroidales bacterium]|nr:DNA repair protein RadC [Bacteroidales bacterium]
MTRHSGNKTIKSWATEDRPREKMLRKGRESLSDAELVAILIGSGNKNETAVDLSRRILADVDNNLIKLSKLSISEMLQYDGVGEAKAVAIAAALELGRRRRFAEAAQKVRINNSLEAFEYFYSRMSDLSHEQFWVLLLSSSNEVMKMERIGVGGLNSTVADPKIIFGAAIENHAAALMLCHNHPSGNVRPSTDDRKLTEKIVNGGKLLDIKVLDHIIIGDDTYYSFADKEEI